MLLVLIRFSAMANNVIPGLAVTCVAHARPCLSTGWALNHRFGLTSGTAAVLAQGGGGGNFFIRYKCSAAAQHMGLVTNLPAT